MIAVAAMIVSFVLMVMKFRTHSDYLRTIGREFKISTFYEALIPIPIKTPEDAWNEQLAALENRINKLTYAFYAAFLIYLISAYSS
jgi:hypothetical protein